MDKNSINIFLAKSPEHFSQAREIILEYTSTLGFDLAFQNFDYEINHLQEMYSEPNGGLILAFVENQITGTAGIRKFEPGLCELKRMYVKESYRNLGIGKRILEKAISLSKELDYNKIMLDTDSSMAAAVKLYQSFGFKEIPAFRYNPHKSARYFELVL